MLSLEIVWGFQGEGGFVDGNLTRWAHEKRSGRGRGYM